MANSVDSSWISPHANYALPANNDAPGAYTYSTTFDLTGLNPNTASFSFVVAVDNSVTDVLLNGVSQTIAYTGLDAFSSLFTINSDFIGGINTLEFVTLNTDTVNTPTGLRVEFSAATADEISDVPEPGSIALLGFGTILLFSRRLRRAK